ncbi:MAG: hypothetical protein K0Q53_871 [Massilibacillus sp.]|jgi:uncharacterized protein (UPF0303 family)|nr:hypothetical protein [Massilibacillus sp.]
MDEIEIIKQEEESLIFDSFNSKDAWVIGNMLVKAAMEESKVITICISLNRHKLFYYAFDGTSVDNDCWVRRKENTVYYSSMSSYQMKLELDRRKQGMAERFGLSESEYIAAGGSVPICLKNTGVVGAITVSGMAQKDDHAYVVRIMKEFLNRK